ncbi:MAG: microviridin/marinostatin family tricyclic proteinase inhibitor [Planktothrix sp.]|jgi:hypothetical protein|uniref:microviridin/marinostatin family tricyclic proteinase inhibitor n=1 Tax=Planktothrix sp. TaxID=3088171 RepID=UPI0038D435D9
MLTQTKAPTNLDCPFFARFLEVQAAEEPTPDSAPTPDSEPQPLPPPIYTFKFPSDWEDC